MTLIRLISCLFVAWAVMLSPAVKSDETLEFAKSEIRNSIALAKSVISRSEECITSRRSVSAGKFDRYAEVCSWSSVTFKDYRDSYEKALHANDVLLNRAEQMLMSDNLAGAKLVELGQDLFFWNDRVETQIKQETELLGTCYAVVISINMILPNCCAEFKTDGLNPPACANQN